MEHILTIVQSICDLFICGMVPVDFTCILNLRLTPLAPFINMS